MISWMAKPGNGRVDVPFDLLFPVPHLFQKIGHVDFLGPHVHYPRMFQHPPGSCSSGGFFFETEPVVSHGVHIAEKVQYIPAVDEILKIVRPANPTCRFILKLRDRLTDNVRKEVDQTGARLHFGTIGWEGEAMLGHFEEGNTKRPDIRGDGIRLSGDSFGGHIVRGSDEGIGIALGAEFATDAKVAELHLAIPAQENVGRFDICRD